MIGDASEHVAQISFGIEAVELGGFKERVGCRGAFTAGIGTGEQIVLPAQRNLAVILPISGRTKDGACLQTHSPDGTTPARSRSRRRATSGHDTGGAPS